jgi:hypothetical protein
MNYAADVFLTLLSHLLAPFSFSKVLRSETNERFKVGQEAFKKVLICPYRHDVSLDEIMKELWNLFGRFAKSVRSGHIELAKGSLFSRP